MTLRRDYPISMVGMSGNCPLSEHSRSRSYEQARARECTGTITRNCCLVKIDPEKSWLFLSPNINGADLEGRFNNMMVT